MREALPRLDGNKNIREKLLPYCRLKAGDVWIDPIKGHRVGVLDVGCRQDVLTLFGDNKSRLFINDPPYNIVVGQANTHQLFKTSLQDYIKFSKKWIDSSLLVMDDEAHFYIWLGADYKEDFQPLPDFMILMRKYKDLSPRNFITLRNQRGYGTQKNWMWVRQELLHYAKGNPYFQVIYTDIPKILRGGYYKNVNGKKVDTAARSKSDTIRPGNVWIDIQQVFYRMQENVSGCYAQKPLKAITRIILSSSREGDIVTDFFAHSGTTLIAGEITGRRVFTMDIDPIYAEITIRRLEHYRKTGKTGWQWHNPFPEIDI